MGFIYCITNKTNEKRYVGQTSTSVEERWQAHIENGRANVKRPSCPALHRAMRKHGVDVFTIECLEECENSQLDERERFWIQELQAFGSLGYNLTNGGESSAGCQRLPLSADARRKISVGNKGKQRSLESRKRYSFSKQGKRNPMFGKPSPKRKTVQQLTLEGELVNVFPSVLSAARDTGVPRNNIRACAEGRYRHAGGYLWKFLRTEGCSEPTDVFVPDLAKTQ